VQESLEREKGGRGKRKVVQSVFRDNSMKKKLKLTEKNHVTGSSSASDQREKGKEGRVKQGGLDAGTTGPGQSVTG